MDIKKIINYLKSLGIPAKIITVIIILLISVMILFLTPACAYKMHVDKIDNLTREVTISPNR